ncbi:winged helix-turn-helix domain-containing protein [Paraburkholderia fungorum]|uniref:winged helix-turn-helix domain-containing protein n=2 Tax=Paraburkholderia fungorum TaxID=134537 RepID=UPI0024203CD0|nr:winged helix-turn-helix domain-containing protein [Paraburkholderia fungorum]
MTRSMVNSQLGRAESQKASLDVAVCRLRGVIEADPSAPRFIQTLRGRGYMFVPSPEPLPSQGWRDSTHHTALFPVLSHG